ncbi:MAG: SdrD B-like domain-containing protein [Candidatus Bathyarchaeia archaeon]
MRRNFQSTLTLTVFIPLLLSIGLVSAATITGTQDDTPGVWLFSAGTDTTPAGQPTDDIVTNAINFGILTLLGNQAGEIVNFAAGPPDSGHSDPPENARDTTLALVVEGLEDIDDFGVIEEGEDPTANFDAGIGGWVKLGNFGEIRADGVVATGTIGPETATTKEQAEAALGGFEIFIFEDAELSGFICTLHLKSGNTITFTIEDKQVNPATPQGADDTLIAIDLDSIPGFNKVTDRVIAITITDDGVSHTPPYYGDTTLELDAVATRVTVITTPGTISGYKWNDENGNGVKDPTEAYLGGWKIILSGNVSKQTTTASDGKYSFTDLPPGTYTVSEELKPGWQQTYPPGSTWTVNLPEGGVVNDKNFGNRIPPPPPPSVGGEGEILAPTSSNSSAPALAAIALGVAAYAIIKKGRNQVQHKD